MTKKLIPISLMLLISTATLRSQATSATDTTPYIRVEDGKFFDGDSEYRFIGTNFWYGPILANEGQGGDRNRLKAELDTLQALGVNNLRILAGGDGEENIPSHIMPVLQSAPGVYNDSLLDGLDYLLAELERRGMKAVIYLNNAWEWSGGYGTYLDWAGDGKTPNPATEGYERYMNHAARFAHNAKAREMAANHVMHMVGRTNRYTGKPYCESEAIMSWQIANEPRAFASDTATKRAFSNWISEQAALIKSIDKNHMVSTGSEGRHGCEEDIALWKEIHSDPNIDYSIIHLWPYNWGWVNEQTLTDSIETACVNARAYILEHKTESDLLGKPLVIEEFGYPRDGFSFIPGSPTEGRDRFYEYIFGLIGNEGLASGCNFWGWGGSATPAHDTWQPWDPYTGDPAQEAQGLNSVFNTDRSTLSAIKKAAKRINEQNERQMTK